MREDLADQKAQLEKKKQAVSRLYMSASKHCPFLLIDDVKITYLFVSYSTPHFLLLFPSLLFSPIGLS